MTLVPHDWYAVKCIIEHLSLTSAEHAHVYEERIVLFRAANFDEAIAKAEQEAADYAKAINSKYGGYSNAYRLNAASIEEGTEVYSLMREATLSITDYIDRYYDDGTDKHR